MTSPYDPNAGYGSQPDPTGQPPYGQPAGGQPGNYPPPDQYGQQYGQPDQYNQPQYYPVDQPADQSYPTSGPSYPASGPGYPTSGPGYPTSGPGYPASGAGYPGAQQGYQQPGYPGGGQPPRSGNGKGLLIGGVIGGGALVFIVVIVLVVVALTKSDPPDDPAPAANSTHSATAGPTDDSTPTDEPTDEQSSAPQNSDGTYTAPSNLCDDASFDAWKDSVGGSDIDPSDNKSGHDPTIEVCVWILGDYSGKHATVSYTGFFESDESGADRMYNYYKDQMKDEAKSGTIKSVSGLGEQAFACVNGNSDSSSTEIDIFVQDGNLLLKEDVMLSDDGGAPSSSTVEDARGTLKKTASATLSNLA